MIKNDQYINCDLSIIIPVYNEARVIEKVIRCFYEKVVKKLPSAKLLIAEDGSTDGTKEVLRKLLQEIPFTLISGKERKGYTKAFKDALGIAETKLVFFSDSDGQQDPEDVFKMLSSINDFDIVSGYKSPRRDPFHRVFISWAYNFLIFLVFGIRLKDIDSGFKLIKKEVIDTVLKDVTSMKHCVMSEFILKAHLSGFSIKEIPVKHYPRECGTTSIFSPTKLPGIIISILINLLEIKFRYKKEEKI
ncbi:glycosyltransferase family 2 protein [Candidatus Omnitrophota bacterium]